MTGLRIPRCTALPATIAERHVSMILPWPGHGQLRIWLLPEQDFALDVEEIVPLLGIVDPSTLQRHPIQWQHEWVAPRADRAEVSYLWSRETVLQLAATLTPDRALGERFRDWLSAHHRDLCLRDWEGTLDMVLPQMHGNPTGEISATSAAERIAAKLGKKYSTPQILERMHHLGWVRRSRVGTGWTPTFEARARELVFSRVVKTGGEAGLHEQAFLTRKGYEQLEQDLRPEIPAPLFEDVGA